jgi:hypothetical protein
MGSLDGILQGWKKLFFRPRLAEKQTARFHWFFFVVFYAVLVNLPFWIAGHLFGFLPQLGWFCAEFAALGLLALFVPPILTAVLLFALIVADIVCGVCVTYSLPFSVCLQNSIVLRAFTGLRLFAVFAILLLALLIAVLGAYLPGAAIRGKDRRRAAACLIAFAVLSVAADVVNVARATGCLPNPRKMSIVADGVDLSIYNIPRFARILSIRWTHLAMIDSSTRAMESADAASAVSERSASAEALRLAGVASGKGRQQLPNLVLVLVESWGWTTEPPLNNALLQAYQQPDLRDRYDVVQGSVPFHGATIAGEARELCGSSIDFHLLDASATELKNCLPARLTDLGYHALALHGMKGSMFSRSAWYSAIGFQEILFNDRMKQQGLPDCSGAFIGTCDASVAEWIGRRLEKREDAPVFVHWMTLNSHLPVPIPATLPAGAPCLPALSLAPHTALCSWYQLVANVHQSVAQLAIGTLGRPTVFVIVGDHAPPFVDPALRKRFSRTVVPYILLLPRANNSSSNRRASAPLAPAGNPLK